MAAGSDPRFEQARRLIRDNQQKEARALLVPILKDDPKNTQALFLYAQVARNDEEAEKVLKRLLDLEPLNYQARAMLNKIQQRSVEDLAAGDVGALLGETAPASPVLQYAVVVVLAVLILGGGVAAAIYFASEEGDGDSTPVAQNPTSTSSNVEVVVQNTRIVVTRAPEVNVADQPTWTAVPTETPRATRTRAPSITPQPTRTLPPTTTPTPPVVAEIERFDLPTLSNLYYQEFAVLSAQAGWAEDTVTLDNISQALGALIASIQMSNYQNESPAVVDLVNEFLILLEQEQRIVRTRMAALEQGEEIDLTVDLEERLVQQNEVERRLQTLVGNATATQEFQDRIDMLRTPSLTPIVLPTVAPGQ